MIRRSGPFILHWHRDLAACRVNSALVYYVERCLTALKKTYDIPADIYVYIHSKPYPAYSGSMELVNGRFMMGINVAVDFRVLPYVIAHEFVHYQQLVTGRLAIGLHSISFDGIEYNPKKLNYQDAPWETDARHREKAMGETIRDHISELGASESGINRTSRVGGYRRSFAFDIADRHVKFDVAIRRDIKS